jgi:hypothetical protein
MRSSIWTFVEAEAILDQFDFKRVCTSTDDYGRDIMVLSRGAEWELEIYVNDAGMCIVRDPFTHETISIDKIEARLKLENAAAAFDRIRRIGGYRGVTEKA